MLTLFHDTAIQVPVIHKRRNWNEATEAASTKSCTGTIHRVAFKTNLWITFSANVFLLQFKTGLMIVHVL